MRLKKRFERMRESPNAVDPQELHTLLLALGFSFRPGKGDHRMYYHPGLQYPLGIDPRKPLRTVYVRTALRAIDEVFPDEPTG